MRLAQAQRYASQVEDALRPYCQRIEIAGSIRRGRPEVKDIDLVIMAPDRGAVVSRIRERCSVQCEGDVICRAKTPNGVLLDIYFADLHRDELFGSVPTNWGSLLLCRTGSAAHNIKLVEHAKTLKLKWSPCAGVFDRDYNLIASETEEAIFEALQLPFVAPENRE